MQSRAGHDHLRGLTHSGVALKSADYWAHARPRHPFNLLVDEPDFESVAFCHPSGIGLRLN